MGPCSQDTGARRLLVTNELVVLTGPPALTQARLSAKLAELCRVDPAASGLFAQFVHFLFLRRPLSVAERRVVDGLLAYGPRLALPARVGEPLCVVTPRPGTISPWSSKATDIVVRCGIDAIERVERGVRWHVAGSRRPELAALLHDRMTECPVFDDDFAFLTAVETPRPLATVALADDPTGALLMANREMGLALSRDEVDYLAATFDGLGRDPTDVELMMFAQANSEHCRHKIFNAAWVVDGKEAPQTLFGMIRNTHRAINGAGVLSAYSDNAAVIEGHHTERFRPDDDAIYRPRPEAAHILMKAETHNHPTAIAPYPGAATGAGGEIRDEGSVGRGSKPKAGLAGFTTSHLELGEALEPWELGRGRPGQRRLGAGDHARWAARCRGIRQRIRPSLPGRLFPLFRGGQFRSRYDVGLPQTGDDRRRSGLRGGTRHSCRDGAVERAVGGAGRSGHADWLGRRRGFEHGFRPEFGAARLCLCAERERGDAASLVRRSSTAVQT